MRSGIGIHQVRPRLAQMLAALGIVVALSAAAAALISPATAPMQKLDGLRVQASVGDADASRRLTLALLDRYRRHREPEALMEAVQWLERDWHTPEYAASRVTGRVFDEHCEHPVLRWHWLCNPSE